MTEYRIGLIVGSLRKESINHRFADALVRLAPPDFIFTQIEIGDLPLYNQDDDAHRADSVLRLKSEIKAADGLLFVTPEYNRSIPGVLKNALDQASRPPKENVWAGKPAGITGTSKGALGTALAQQHLRLVFAYLDVHAMGQPEAYIRMTDTFYDEDGNIGPGSRDFLQGWMDHFVAWVKRFVAA